MTQKKKSKLRVFIKKHFSILVVFAIMLIPSIYTVLFLGSMWDPYGNTGNLPVAIVNEDQAVIYNGKQLNIGEQLCDNLKQNSSLQFNFVDEDVALAGLENSTYYMVMVIPSDFSANSTTLTSDNPQKMEITYYTNPGTNYIASKFGESAVKTIKESLNKTVINTYATTVYSKLDTIGEGFTAAADGSNQIYNGVGTLKDGNSQITDGLDTLSAGCLTLKEGTGTLEDGLKQYTDGVVQVDQGVKQVYDGTNQLVDNNEALNNGAGQLLDGLNTMSDTLGESLSDKNLEDLQTLENGLISINDGIQTLQKAINEDYKIDDEKLEEIQSSIDEMDEFVKSDNFATLCKILNLSAIDWDSLSSTLNRLSNSALLRPAEKQVIESLKTVVDALSSVQGLGEQITPENAEKLVSGANSLLSAYSQLSDGVQQLSDGGNQALPTASETLKTLTNGLLSVQDALDRTKENDGQTGLIEGMTTLKDGIKTYTDGVGSVNNGVGQIYAGTQQLVSNNKKLNSGASQLDDGAAQLSDGATKLYDGSLQIDAGCDKLMAGAKTLEDSLADGAKQISETNTGEDAADMFSQPVEATEVFQRNINSNGEAMSAYMMCAGLWVACLAYCLMFSPFKTSLANRKGQRTFLTHGIISFFVAVIQAPIMVSLIMAIDGMRPAHVLQTYLMAILASVAFMTLIYMLSTLLGSVGSFLLLVLLCLQLSGAAGTYPIELSPKFYQIIHPFMPFTYGVDAFRSTISTGNDLTKDIMFFLCMIVVSVLLTVLTFFVRKIRHTKQYRLQLQQEIDKEIEYYNAEMI